MNIEELKNIINEFKDKFDIKKSQSNQLLLKQYNNLFKNTSEMLYLINNYDNLENLHIFCYCGNKNNFININIGYRKYCSNKCRANDIEYKNKMNSKRKEIQQKQQQTKLEKYGDPNYNNRHKAKQTWLKIYGVDNPNKNKQIREKIEQTNIIKFGIDNPWKSKEVINKIKVKRKNDIDENGLNSFQRSRIKCIQTMRNTIDENGLNSYQRSIKKGKQTKKLRYGNENYNNIEKAKQTSFKINKDGLNIYEYAHLKKINTIDENGLNIYQKSVIKQYETKKKNNSFAKSKPEEECYQLLLQKFDKDDIERQYKSNLYPFASDFYIKSLNLYIECNFSWTHNNHPFDKNSVEDLQKLEKLKKKTQEINFKGKKKDYYNNMIYTWVDLDVRKLQTFKKNKLNFKIFYNIEQFKNWYNNYL